MAATIKLVGENDTGRTFAEAAEGLDKVEEHAREAGVALDDMGDKADRAARQVERVDAQGGRMESLKSGVTAVSTGFLAVAEGAKAVYEGAQKAYEMISRLAESGDADMLRLKTSIDSTGDALDRLGAATITLVSGGDVKNTSDAFDALTVGIAGLTAKIKEGPTDADWKSLLGLTSLYSAPGAIADFAESLTRAGVAQETAASATNKRTAAQKALDAALEAGEKQRAARDLAEKTDLDELQQLYMQQVELLEDVKAGKAKASDEEIKQAAEDIVALEQRRVQIVKERADAEKKAGEDALKAADELAKKEAERLAKEAEERQRLVDLEKDLRAGVAADERAARQQAAEDWLKAQGNSDETLHESRMTYLREELDAALAAADTEEERIRARVQGEAKLDAELQRERLRQIDERAAKEKQALADAEKAKAGSVAERRKGGDSFAEILGDRQKEAAAKFQEENKDRIAKVNDPNSGMTPAARQREIAELNRALSDMLRGVRLTAIEEAKGGADQARPERRGGPQSIGRDRPDVAGGDRAAEAERRREQLAERQREAAERVERAREQQAERQASAREELAARQKDREAEVQKRRAELDARRQGLAPAGGGGREAEQLAGNQQRQAANAAQGVEAVGRGVESATAAIDEQGRVMADLARRMKAIENANRGSQERTRAVRGSLGV